MKLVDVRLPFTILCEKLRNCFCEPGLHATLHQLQLAISQKKNPQPLTMAEKGNRNVGLGLLTPAVRTKLVGYPSVRNDRRGLFLQTPLRVSWEKARLQ